MSAEPLLAGVAEVEITPDHPVPLAGFAVRTGPFVGVDRPLFLRAIWLSTGDAHALMVTADILWWPPERVDALRAEIAARWPVPEDHILLHATHTHGGPQPSTGFTPSLGPADAAWVQSLEDALLAAVETAWEARRPAQVARGRGSTRIGINRRFWRGEEPASDGYPEGVIDRDVDVLRIATPEDEPLAILVHHACHPTTTQLPRVTADFPGVMAACLRERTGAIAGFLQGTCGDINPRVTIDRDIRGIGDEDVALLGEELAEDVLRILDGPMAPVRIDGIRTQRATALLPFRHVPDVDALERLVDAPDVTGEWARLLRAHPERLQAEIPVAITHLRLGDDLGFLAMDAEVTTPFGLAIKAATQGRTLPLPYTNGMIGYVVTDAQLAEGGYEADESTPYFGLPSPFAPGIEGAMTTAITEALES